MKTLTIMIMMLAFCAPATAQSEDWLKWSRDDCKKILERHREVLGVSDLHVATIMTGGIGKTADVEANFFIWLSRPAAQAYARLIQQKQHLSDDEARAVLAKLRPPDAKTFAIVLFTRSEELGRASIFGTTMKEGAKPEELGSRGIDLKKNLFLLPRKEEDQASRVIAVEEMPDDVLCRAVSRIDTAFGVIARFDRNMQNGEPLVKSLNDEITVSFVRLGKARKMKFKLKDFKLAAIENL